MLFVNPLPKLFLRNLVPFLNKNKNALIPFLSDIQTLPMTITSPNDKVVII